MFSLNEEFIMVHESSKLAVDWLKLNGYPKATQGSLGCALRGIYSKAYGYKWQYEYSMKVSDRKKVGKLLKEPK